MTREPAVITTACMPIYEYRCEKCGDFELTQRISDPPAQRCPKCRRKVRRLISNTSFQLKGSGWYVTDYARGGASKDADGAANGTATESASDAKSDTKSDTKPGTTTEKKAEKKKSESKASAVPAAASSGGKS